MRSEVRSPKSAVNGKIKLDLRRIYREFLVVVLQEG